MFRSFALSLLLISLSGCSVYLAATSPEEPDLSVLSPGTPRTSVDKALGRPFKRSRLSSGSSALYQFFSDDSANARRAAAYALLDGLTLGLAELVTFPAEALQGSRHVVTVFFDHRERVVRSRIDSFGAPLAPPERILGLEEYLAPDADVGRAPGVSATATEQRVEGSSPATAPAHTAPVLKVARTQQSEFLELSIPETK